MDSPRRRVLPNDFSRFRLKGRHRRFQVWIGLRGRRRNVHEPPNQQGLHLEPVISAVIEGPRWHEVLDVRGCDLCERREIRVVLIVWPLVGRLLTGRRGGHENKHDENGGRER